MVIKAFVEVEKKCDERNINNVKCSFISRFSHFIRALVRNTKEMVQLTADIEKKEVHTKHQYNQNDVRDDTWISYEHIHTPINGTIYQRFKTASLLTIACKMLTTVLN